MFSTFVEKKARRVVETLEFSTFVFRKMIYIALRAMYKKFKIEIKI